MFVKTVSVIAASAICVLSVRAFAEPTVTAGPQVAVVGGNLQTHAKRELITKTAMEWPKSVPQTREARVVLHYTIEANGTVDNVQAVFAPFDPAFVDSAKEAVSNWVYAPADKATPNVEAVAYFHAAP